MEVNRRQIIQSLIARATGNASVMFRIAELLRAEGDELQAVDWCGRALALAADDLPMTSRCRAFLSKPVPGWHFQMLTDHHRNQVYDAAIRRAIRPGARVLDIGTGSGLLAMMAARAGASMVFACEAEPAIARAATEIVAANGYSDRVRVIARHSSTLRADADLGGRVDVLLSEIIAGNLIGEGVLPSHEHAVRELLVPGGRVVPARGTIHAALAAFDGYKPSPLAMVEGFDLSIFNRLRRREGSVPGNSNRLQLRGATADLFAFDFASMQYRRSERTRIELTSDGGMVNGVIQWFTLELDDEIRYDTLPARGVPRSWMLDFYPLERPRHTAPGETLVFHAAHDRTELLIWPAD